MHKTKTMRWFRPSTSGKVSSVIWSHDMKAAAKKEVYNKLVSDIFSPDIMYRNARYV